jgi:hypothetical protein
MVPNVDWAFKAPARHKRAAAVKIERFFIDFLNHHFVDHNEVEALSSNRVFILSAESKNQPVRNA